MIGHKRVWVFEVGQRRDEGTTTAEKMGKLMTLASPASEIFILRAQYCKMFIKTAHYSGLHKTYRQSQSHSHLGCLTADTRTSATSVNRVWGSGGTAGLCRLVGEK